MTGYDIIDLDEALERMGGDRALLLELMGDFVKDFKSRRKGIDELIDKKDFEKIKEVIHFIKGGAGNISLKPIFECCMLIEYLSKEKDSSLIIEVMADIDRQFEEFQDFVAGFKKESK